MSLRSKRFTNTAALLVAFRGGVPPRGTTERSGERGTGEKGGGRKVIQRPSIPAAPPGGSLGLAPPAPLCPLRVLWRSQLGSGCYSALDDEVTALLSRPQDSQRTCTGGGPQVTEGQGPQPRREGNVQSVTETTILRISSASWGSGFSRSSMTWVVRILPVLLLRL